MKIIRPLPTLCEHILSYNVTQTIPLWNVATSYAKDAQVVIEGCGAIVYQSLTSSNVGNPPATSPTNWAAVGVSNYFAMFDAKVGTQTINENTIEIEVSFDSAVNSVAIVNVEALSARFEAWDTSNTKLVDMTVNLRDYGCSDWWEYFFKPFDMLDRYVAFNLPLIGAGRGKLTLDNTGGIAKIGALVYGEQYEIGTTQSGLSLGIKDYSLKSRDDFGNYQVVERSFSDRIEADISIATGKVGAIRKILAQYRATPLVWSAADGLEATIVFGYYESFNINLSNHGLSDCTIQIEGLV